MGLAMPETLRWPTLLERREARIAEKTKSNLHEFGDL
jgi:hypothetical protein